MSKSSSKRSFKELPSHLLAASCGFLRITDRHCFVRICRDFRDASNRPTAWPRVLDFEALRSKVKVDDTFLAKFKLARPQTMVLTWCTDVTAAGLAELKDMQLERLEAKFVTVSCREGLQHLNPTRLRSLDITQGRSGGMVLNTSMKHVGPGLDALVQWLCKCSSLTELCLVYNDLTTPHFQQLADARVPIQSLQLSREKLKPEAFIHISRLPLTSLSVFSSGNVTDACIQHLFAPASECKATLKTLELSSCGLTDKVFSCIAGSSLTELHVYERDIGSSEFAHLRRLPLTKLELFLNAIRGDDLVHLAGLPLRSLSLSGSTKPTSAASALCDGDVLNSLRNLQSFRMPSYPLFDLNKCSPAFLRGLRQLTLANIDDTIRIDEWMQRFSPSYPEAKQSTAAKPATDAKAAHAKDQPTAPTGLTELSLTHCEHLTAEGLKAVAHMPVRSLVLDGCAKCSRASPIIATITTLTKLSLQHIPVIDEDLAPLAKLTNLTELDMWHTAITPLGLLHIADLPFRRLEIEYELRNRTRDYQAKHNDKRLEKLAKFYAYSMYEDF